MERPEIKDKHVLEYVEFIEKQLLNFQAETTIAESYIATKKFIDRVNRVVFNVEIDEKTITNKDDKVIDRASKFVDNILDYNDKLKKLEAMVNPKAIEDAKSEMRESGGFLEEAIRKSENGASRVSKK